MTEIKEEVLLNTSSNKEKEADLSFFTKKAEETQKLEKFYLDEEKTEYLEYYPIFGRDKRDNVIKELFKTIVEAEEKNIDFFKTFEQEDLYLNFLIVKHFVPKFYSMLEGKDIPTHIEVMTALYQSDYIAILINEMFDLKEVDKIMNQHTEARARAKKISHMIEASLTHVNNTVQNQGLKQVAEKSMKGKK